MEAHWHLIFTDVFGFREINKLLNIFFIQLSFSYEKRKQFIVIIYYILHTGHTLTTEMYLFEVFLSCINILLSRNGAVKRNP